MKKINRTIPGECFEFSERLALLSQKLDLSSATTPLNQSQEREKFFAWLKQGKEYNPSFIYPPPKADIANLQREIDSIFPKRGLPGFKEIALLHSLEKTRAYLTKKIKLLEVIGRPEFSRRSISLYGKPGAHCLKIARRILESNAVECNETVTAKTIEEALEEEIRKFNLDWKVKLVDTITTKVSISALNKEVLVNEKLKFTPFEVERLKVHEIDIHVLRAENGSRQPLRIFQTGLGGYQETEEGLSVYFEEKTNNLDRLQEKLYAARALGVVLALKGDFFSVFSQLSQYLPRELAYRISERVKRGLSDTSGRGGFSKDYYYISGREKIREYIRQGGDVRILFVGKIGLGDIDFVQRLLNRTILSQPAILPEFISNVNFAG